MKPFPRLLVLSVSLLLATGAHAEDRDGLRVTLTKSVVGRETERFGIHERVQVTTKEVAVKVRVQNLRPAELPESSLKYTLQLERGMGLLPARGPGGGPGSWGGRSGRDGAQTRTGTLKVPALKANASADLDLTTLKLQSANVSSKEEGIEGWKLVFEIPDGRTVSFQSPGFHEAKR